MIGPCQDTLQSISFLGQKDEFMFSLFFFISLPFELVGSWACCILSDV